MRPLFMLAFISSMVPVTLQAQESEANGFSCLANHPEELQRHLDATPGAFERAQQAKVELDLHTAQFQRGGERSPYVITVVVHIIHDNGPENITDEQVYDAIRILNEDFNKQNPDWQNVHPDFLDIVGDVGIEFRLARKDPQGICTNGITRTVSSLTSVGDFDMTQLIQWPRDRYMNVWVSRVANGAAGYTYYPEWLDDWPEADGMVILANYVGSIGTSNYSRSRVLSHEVGHWLNLKHCWGDSNEPGSDLNCAMDDDVEDTPLTRGWTSCVLNGASCGSLRDNVENYMEYSYCDKMFTEGQADRMVAALTSPIAQRNSLWQLSTLQATGVADVGQLCLVQFAEDKSEICVGNSITFRDESYHNVVERTWSFAGGTPAGSSEQFPTVTYSVPGTYTVTLTVSDGNTTGTLEKVGLVTVLPDPGQNVPFEEGFESAATMGVNWVVRNPDEDATFTLTDAAAYTGNGSIRLANSALATGRKDDLVSTTFDMSTASGIRITYRYAFARRDPSNDDRLRVYVSNNCGSTWSLRQQLRGSNTLASAGTVAGNFLPAAPDDWGHAELDNISSAYHTSDFRVRFEFESNGGNDLYLDDININGQPVGIGSINGMVPVMRIVPNPASDHARMEIQVEQAGPFHIEIMDALGRSVVPAMARNWSTGPQLLDLPVHQLTPGTYILSVQMSETSRNIRFVVR